jgi:hypothetical protein
VNADAQFSEYGSACYTRGVSGVPRFFSLRQAEQLLPEIERLVRSLVQAKRDYDAGDAEIGALKQRITLLGGVSLARETAMASRARKEAAARTLKSVVEKIEIPVSWISRRFTRIARYIYAGVWANPA